MTTGRGFNSVCLGCVSGFVVMTTGQGFIFSHLVCGKEALPPGPPSPCSLEEGYFLSAALQRGEHIEILVYTIYQMGGYNTLSTMYTNIFFTPIPSTYTSLLLDGMARNCY